jgi:hypothetical protein
MNSVNKSEIYKQRSISETKCKIKLTGATLPVIAFLLLGIYGKVILLIIASMILGVGHIGIHLQHINNLKTGCKP